MGIVKLKEVGDSLTMTVTECEAVKGNYGDQVKFVGNGDTLFLPKDSADRQLDRLNLSAYADVVGETLTFSRTENKKKGAAPYWNVDVATPTTTTPSKRLPPPEQRTTKTAHRAGPDIPGMDEAMGEDGPYEDTADGPPAWHNAPPPPDPEMAGPWDTEALQRLPEPELTPREVREREAQAKGEQTPADRFFDWYIDTYAKMLAGLSAVHTAAVSANVGPRSREAEAIPPLTSDTVQAAVATYTIQCEKRGWFR